MPITLFILISFFAVLALAYGRAVGVIWSASAIVLLVSGWFSGALPQFLFEILLGITVVLSVVLNFKPLRRALVSNPALAVFRAVMPHMSQTEQEALEAGTVWWEGELFSGRPDFSKLLAYPKPALSADECAFLEGPVTELCNITNDWETSHELHDLPPHVWQFIKDNGFLGMIIPKQYGGLEFSAYAHSQVVMKLSSHCSATAVTVMVPNSLGPAELLLHYGTEAQKNHYLPRLAQGIDVPCFALTSPEAGSDAAAIPDFGIVCKGEWEGRTNVLGMRVTWDKRYITLGPVATLLGLAFKLYDPDGLLGSNKDLGITCALIPTDTPGVNIGRRHFPLNAAFQNGPNSGNDVFIPIDWIIGGAAMAGHGWRMLMECLAAGRSISLPSSNVGMAKLATRGVGGYARVRSQFKTPIGKFEGIEEALARMGGHTYMMDAARMMTAAAIDLGERPSVVSAIVKYHVTERGRMVVNDGMDIIGGKGICLGPNNFLGRAYQQIPVAITVEGANILTRSLIIFGQGAIRCHPYVLKEIAATREPDRHRASVAFDAALFGHIGHVLCNAARALVLGVTAARFIAVPGDVHTSRYYRKLARLSAGYAMLADFAMLILGGDLKRREKMSARLGDVLAQMYLISCTLKRYEDDGRPAEDLPLLHWSILDAFYRARVAIDGLLANFPVKTVAALLWRLAYPLGRPFAPPSDVLGHQVARLLIEPSATRDRLTHTMYLPSAETSPMGAIEAALILTLATEPLSAKIRTAQKAGKIAGRTREQLERDAVVVNIISEADYLQLQKLAALRHDVIRVDDFPQDFGVSHHAENPDAAFSTSQRVAA